jgi:protein-tyrosine-phosphatase
MNLGNANFNILIVCTGNTCRSPLAEGILRSLLAARGIDHVAVSSAGIGAMSGMPATPFGVEVARHWNIDISGHRAQQVSKKVIADADLILAMSPEHVDYILQKDPSAITKTYLIRAFPQPYSSSQEGVKDPVGGTLEEYNQTYLELDEILRRIVGKIIEISGSLKKDR